MTVPRLSHLDAHGEARMVDVSGKPESFRTAIATGRIVLQPATLALIHADAIAKGNVLATARLAGIGAAKQTSSLIPLCHTLLLQHVTVDFEPQPDGFAIRAEVRTVGRTGAEMEALTAVSVAALTVYDMCKAVDKTMRIEAITLASKSKLPVGPDGLRAGGKRGLVPPALRHRFMQSPAPLSVGILTVSDRAAAGEYEDLGGPALRAEAGRRGWEVLAEAVVPDDEARIREAIRAFCAQGCGLILTTGGTGIAPRDVTPEAIRGLMRVELPGFGEVMRAESMRLTPNAILSRAMAAVVERSLVVALPGKPQGAVDCLNFVSGALPHGVKLAGRVPTSC